jgi:hypothetical protein
MSKNRLDALTVREYEQGGEKKTAWTRIGVAFERDKGGWDIRLDALPINGRIMLMEPKPRDDGGGQRRGGGHDASTSEDPDSQIPF